ncbi:MAG: hypothetical protein AAF138_00085 [Planctomycetota bacterium]
MLKRLGKLLGREGGGETPRLRAAVFGKHPGWADHMEEIGLETPGLVDLRRALYSEGIARVVDSGAWEALDDADRLERIEHTFVRRWKGTLTIGRLWSSEDGRGRKKYPMVVAVESDGLPAARAIRLAMPACSAAREVFVATRDADGVRAAFATLQDDLRRLASREERAPEPPGRHLSALASMASSPAFGGGREGLYRTMHALEMELGAELGASSRSAGSSASTSLARARQVAERGGRLRGPAPTHGAGGPENGMGVGSASALSAWLDLVEPLTGGRASLLAFGAPDDAWVDVIAGDAGPSALGCLRTGAGVLPLVTEVPYEVSDELRRRVDDALGQRPGQTSEGLPGGSPGATEGDGAEAGGVDRGSVG